MECPFRQDAINGNFFICAHPQYYNGDTYPLCVGLEHCDIYGQQMIMAQKYLTKTQQTNTPDPEASKENDIIAHPAHYTEGREYEPKDVIYDWGLDFNLGSAVKYISRAGRKDDIIQDLKKAIQFIQFEIDAIEKKKVKEKE